MIWVLRPAAYDSVTGSTLQFKERPSSRVPKIGGCGEHRRGVRHWMQRIWPEDNCALSASAAALFLLSARNPNRSRSLHSSGIVSPPSSRLKFPIHRRSPAYSPQTQTSKPGCACDSDPISMNIQICEFDSGLARGYICAGPEHRQNSDPRQKTSTKSINVVFVSAAIQGPGVAGTRN